MLKCRRATYEDGMILWALIYIIAGAIYMIVYIETTPYSIVASLNNNLKLLLKLIFFWPAFVIFGRSRVGEDNPGKSND